MTELARGDHIRLAFIEEMWSKFSQRISHIHISKFSFKRTKQRAFTRRTWNIHNALTLAMYSSDYYTFQLDWDKAFYLYLCVRAFETKPPATIFVPIETFLLIWL